MSIAPAYKPRAIVFDVDKTLTPVTVWYELDRQLKADPAAHADAYIAYRDGSLSFKQAKESLFKIWRAHYNAITRQLLQNIFLSIEPKGSAVATIRALQQKGYHICLISASIEMYVQLTAERLGVEDAYGNSKFIFDEHDNWVDFEYDRDEAGLKVKQLQHFIDKHGYQLTDCVAVGDGESDLELFRVIPGVAVEAESDHLKQLAWQDIHYITKLEQLIESLPDRA
ncbi:MAG: hypothetical protein COU69_02635 [Candidatus Pacebacteria bacterium CG10_big_fil_rev_8_21_14_0_10_56_10]|nr:MAG: hypothetical protein COU69_02635 [Candidatus Pacebacteria bacterium CG10_big_fil_rev_8_21_14_0_10_56_10]